MTSYYTEKLATERLRACYDLAPPRTRAHLEAKIEFVLRRTRPSMVVLELGCGYGRVLERLLPAVHVVFGIDTSLANLRMALQFTGGKPSLRLACVNNAIYSPNTLQCVADFQPVAENHQPGETKPPELAHR